ncbi:MAG TPA: AI-2E family transporter, partial [Chloroflexota bacterium]|nr:AI-2E family transporter [Chloroflexota bacterium]
VVRVENAHGVTYRQLRHLVVGTVALVVGVIILAWVAIRTVEVLTLLAVSVVLAVALRPTADRLNGLRIPFTIRRMPRALAILLIYLFLAAVAAGIGFLAIPPLIVETEKLITSFPAYIAQLSDYLEFLRRYPFVPDLGALESQLVNQLVGNLAQAITILLFAVNVLSGMLSIGVVVLLTFFLIYDAELIYEHLISLVPITRRETARHMTSRMGYKIEGWLKGTITLAVVLGVSTGVAMWLLGMPYPILLGLAAGIFELVPMIGPYLGAAPAVIAALFIGPTWRLIAVILFFIAIQQLENNVLAPTIMGRQVDLPPLLVILALLLGAAIRGIVGALLAVPVMAVLQVLWLDLVVPEIRQRVDRVDQGPAP